MFSALGENFIKILDKIKSKGTISENDLTLALRSIRISMLESDVALGVTKSFVDDIKRRAIGKNVIRSINPGQMIVKIVHDELKKILGDKEQDINLNVSPPAVIMLVGLQGVGKTTTAAKLALYLKKKHKKKVLLVSLDTYRPSAQEQLAILGKQISVDTLSIRSNDYPLDITRRALQYGNSGLFDLVILDTAGRLHTDKKLVDEIVSIKNIAKPIETLLVVDSMAGQDAVNSAKQFHEDLQLTGVILTKIDGDSRGGAALSIKYVTDCPIKFIGNGEKLSDLEKFYPERIASRILDMGDVVTLVEKAIDTAEEDVEQVAKRIQGGTFNMEDFRKQLNNIKKMGSMSSIMGMIPGFKAMKKNSSSDKFYINIMTKQEAIIDSMTTNEKQNPKIMNASRKCRVAKGSGVAIQDINKLLKQFMEMQKMMKKVGGFNTNNLKGLKDILSTKHKYRM